MAQPGLRANWVPTLTPNRVRMALQDEMAKKIAKKKMKMNISKKIIFDKKMLKCL